MSQINFHVQGHSEKEVYHPSFVQYDAVINQNNIAVACK